MARTDDDPADPDPTRLDPVGRDPVGYDLIDSLAALEARYPAARPSSRRKQRATLTPAMHAWLEHAPFFVLSSLSDEGIDCSPRGDAPGEAFRLLDRTRIAIPDRRGNNRIDTLRNIVGDPRVGLVFMVPGVEETLRVRGRATISVAASLLESFQLDGHTPASVIVVAVEAVWVQNFRAIRRAALWDERSRVTGRQLPDAAALSAPDSASDTPST